MTILITGASRGIGAGLAKAYGDAGHTVIGTSRASDAPYPLDVSDPASHAALAAQIGDQPIDLLICNAGVYLDRGQSIDGGFAPELWADTFATNVTGVFLTVQTFLPNLRSANSAKIAIISSQMGASVRAKGGSYIYRASKAAVLNLGLNLASDLRNEGIAVGIYHPGWVQTDMGGPTAAITEAESVAGLMDRFASLSMETTGVFENWDGRPHAF